MQRKAARRCSSMIRQLQRCLVVCSEPMSFSQCQRFRASKLPLETQTHTWAQGGTSPLPRHSHVAQVVLAAVAGPCRRCVGNRRMVCRQSRAVSFLIVCFKHHHGASNWFASRIQLTPPWPLSHYPHKHRYYEVYKYYLHDYNRFCIEK